MAASIKPYWRFCSMRAWVSSTHARLNRFVVRVAAFDLRAGIGGEADTGGDAVRRIFPHAHLHGRHHGLVPGGGLGRLGGRRLGQVHLHVGEVRLVLDRALQLEQPLRAVRLALPERVHVADDLLGIAARALHLERPEHIGRPALEAGGQVGGMLVRLHPRARRRLLRAIVGMALQGDQRVFLGLVPVLPGGTGRPPAGPTWRASRSTCCGFCVAAGPVTSRSTRRISVRAPASDADMDHAAVALAGHGGLGFGIEPALGRGELAHLLAHGFHHVGELVFGYVGAGGVAGEVEVFLEDVLEDLGGLDLHLVGGAGGQRLGRQHLDQQPGQAEHQRQARPARGARGNRPRTWGGCGSIATPGLRGSLRPLGPRSILIRPCRSGKVAI